MPLSIEWKRRIDRWRQELPRHFYRPLGTVEFTGFTTKEQLTPEQALTHEFRPMPAGTAWGAKWEYGWFRGEIVLPEAARGRRIALRVETGGESLVFVDGRAAGARDHGHGEITLSMSGVPGQRCQVLVEGYGGHGPMVEGGGPVAYGRESVPEPGPTQRVMGETTFGIWVEEAYQLWLDVEALRYVALLIDPSDLRGLDAETLRQVLTAGGDGSLRTAEIEQGLMDFTTIVDYEVPPEEMRATFRAARERLRPLLECHNGSTAPTFFAVGHAHLDVAWLWPLQETERKMARTISNQLALMEEYPDYRYIQPQPHLYRMLEAHYPELYERFKAAVARGQVIPEGGMWVEADTNISGGESLIRQFIYGKRFYREEFGVESRMLWLPDVFGYSGALPQIMRGCGIDYFATAKIYWAYNGGDPFPYSTFTWEGIDGSPVRVHLLQGYGNVTHPGMLNLMWRQRRQWQGIATEMLVFGHGDGGGGATRDHLEFLQRERDLEGCPRVRMASPAEYFQDLEARGFPEARYVGELYFQAHRGTYTSQARTKRGNRKSELALREAELWGVTARALKGFSLPATAIEGAWRTVLLNQFHDVIPGSSIRRVYEEAEAMHAAVIRTAEETAQAAASAFAGGGEGVTVFNSLSWPRRALVALPEGMAAAVDGAGRPLPLQVVDGRRLVEVDVPSCGWTTVRNPLTPAPSPTGRGETPLTPVPSPAGRGETHVEQATVERGTLGCETPAPSLRGRGESPMEQATEERGTRCCETPAPSPVGRGESLVEQAAQEQGTSSREPSGAGVRPLPGGEGRVRGSLTATPTLLENDLLRLTIDGRGQVTSIYDKEAGRELAAGPCNSLKMYKDVPGWFDAWDVDSQYELTPVELPEPATVEVLAEGPLVAALRVSRRLHHSALTQEIRLRAGSRRVDFDTVVDWQESHKLLKVAFPVDVHADEGVHEIQFGHIRRPNHRSRPFDADRFEVANHKWSALMEEGRGVAILNDCKYGVNVLGNSINLTLLKSALAPDMYADKGEQRFTYAFYAWNGPFAGCDVVREAYDLNVPALVVPGAAGEGSLLAVDAASVVVETVKPAEDGSADVIVRLYEAKRSATRCTLTTSLPVTGAVQTDMLEEKVERELPCHDGRIELEFRPFEIKTVRLIGGPPWT